MRTSPDAAGLTGRRALVLAAAYLALSILWRILVEGGTGVAIITVMLARGVPLDGMTPEALESVMSAELLAVASIVQLFGLGLIAVGMAWFALPNPRAMVGTSPASGSILAVGAVGGLTVGFFPGWVAQTLTELLPWLDLGNLAMLNDLLLASGWLGRGLMVVAIVLVAPVVEELIFRGFLWETLSRALPGWATWLLTSALFALYHIDPIHVAAVFFTGLFLGWLRWASGSVGPAIAAHAVNNGLAAVVVLALPNDQDAANPGWAAALSVLITAGLGALAWRLGRKERA